MRDERPNGSARSNGVARPSQQTSVTVIDRRDESSTSPTTTMSAVWDSSPSSSWCSRRSQYTVPSARAVDHTRRCDVHSTSPTVMENTHVATACVSRRLMHRRSNLVFILQCRRSTSSTAAFSLNSTASRCCTACCGPLQTTLWFKNALLFHMTAVATNVNRFLNNIWRTVYRVNVQHIQLSIYHLTYVLLLH